MSIKLKGSSDGSVSFDAPADTSPSGSDITLTLPTSAGSADQFLKNSGTAGTLEYSSMVETSTGVGIGTSSPAVKAHISNGYTAPTGGFDGNIFLAVTNNSSSSNAAGLALSAGATGAAFIHFGDTDDANVASVVYDNDDNSMRFATNASERMRIDSSGRLLVGNTSTSNAGLLCVKGSAADSTGGGQISVQRGTSITGANQGLGDYNFGEGSANSAKIRAFTNANWTGASRPTYMTFETTPSSSGSPTERMRLDSSGRLLVGTTSLTNYGTVNAYTNSAIPGLRCVAGSSTGLGSAVAAFEKHANVNSTSQVFVVFTINSQNTGSGQINANGASQAAFGSFSDRRLKENIVDLPSQLDNICRLRPVEFDYIESEGGGHQTSFIAQEFEEIYPDAVGEREDGMKTLTGWGKTEAILVKALQEAIGKIETLETQNTAQQTQIDDLLARVTALEAA